MPSPYDFSSMTALICFEAAARHASFKKAAQEMNVTPAAVSHQIKALESDLGCSLFLRRSRGVELTEKGALLFVTLQRNFEALSDTVSQLRDRQDKVDVTIRATTAVSSLWLTPKITAFWKVRPDITVSQVVSDIPVSMNRCDLSVHYGNPLVNAGDELRELFQDRIIALGTHKFAREHTIRTVDDLLRVPLIHSNNDDGEWTTWDEWLRARGRPASTGRSFYVNNYMIALQAAQDDIGAVLGWDGLVGGLLEEKRLVQLVPDSMTSPLAFHLKIHARATAKARLFADWLAKGA